MSKTKEVKSAVVVSPVWTIECKNVTQVKHDKAMLLLTAEQVSTMKACPTTSARIRYLDSLGLPKPGDRARIGEILDKRYQHVRNVLVTPLSGPAVK